MTEAEWLFSSDPGAMLARRGRASERQLMLFGCACCERHRELLRKECCRRAVAAAESFADGCCDIYLLGTARDYVRFEHPLLSWPVAFASQYPRAAAWLTAFDDSAAKQWGERQGLREGFDDALCALQEDISAMLSCAAARQSAAAIPDGVRATDTSSAVYHRERATHCDLLRDIFGNPFRPAALDHSWRTDTAVALARQMYDSRDFSAMPILADALQDAGCDNEYILNHCRDPQQMHVRGCWVIDLILGRNDP